MRAMLGSSRAFRIRSAQCYLSTECILLFVNSQRQLFHFSRLLYFISTPPPSPSPRWELDLVTSRVVFCVGILGAILALLMWETDQRRGYQFYASRLGNLLDLQGATVTRNTFFLFVRIENHRNHAMGFCIISTRQSTKHQSGICNAGRCSIAQSPSRNTK